jgi:hypothetical protein
VALKKPRYLILYKIETSDPAAVRAEIQRRAKNGQTRQSPTITNVKMYTYWLFRPEMKGVGGEVKAAKPGNKETYLHFVFGNATAGMDANFNEWYDRVHEPELLQIPGFTRGWRATLSDAQLAPTDEGANSSQYLAIFEIQTADLAATLKGMPPPTGEPPPSFDRARTFGYTYRAIGPVMDGDRIRAERKKAAAR